MTAIHDPLLPHPDRDARAVALTWNDGRPCTHGDLWDVRARCDAFLGSWLPPDARVPRVLSLLPDEPGSALAVLSLASRTAVAPVNPALSDDELRAYVADLRPNAAMVRADRPADRRRAEALGLPLVELAPVADSHCADVEPTARDRTVAGAGHDEPGLILSTSGSTGSPKRVHLSTERMQRSASNIAAWLRLGPGDRALHMLPLFHVGAFVDLVLAPLGSGGSVHFGHPITTERLSEAITHGRATWVQLVPTMLHHLLEQADGRLAEAASQLRFVRTVSADLAPTLQARAHALFGDTPIIQMYGMTETAGQITSNPLPPGKARAGSVGLPAGPEVTIMDPHGNPRAAGETGEVCVAGPTVMSGYLDHDGDDVFHGRWFRTGDLGYLDASGFLTLTGRRKEMINRGGEKISPVEIERVLLEHPDVLEAVAVGVPHPTLGEEPFAAVVPRPGRHVDPATVLAHADAGLADFRRPRRIVVVEGLPRLGSGKVDRQRVRTLADASGEVRGLVPSTEARGTARTPLGRQLEGIWIRTLGGQPPGDDTDFFDAGGDSLAATTFVTAVEAKLGVELPANLLYETPTFGGIVRVIGSLPRETPPADELVRAVRRAVAGWAGQRAGPHELLVGRRTFGARTPFFFITPGLTGSEELLAALHAERPVYVMRTLSKLRSRFGRRLQNDANKRRLAEIYRAGILSVQPGGPILLGGFCQGADVARLVAEALRDAGREVALLCVIDRLFTEPVGCRAAVVWTSGSEHSGDTQFVDSERHLDLLYPAGLGLLHEPADHLAALRGDAAGRVADFFERSFEQVTNGSPGPVSRVPRGDADTDLRERRRRHSARIRLSSSRFGAPGRDFHVRARVTNTSPVPWHPRDDELLVCARWMNLDGRPRTLRSAAVPIDRTVDPGETVTVDFSMPYPDRVLPMVLMTDVVDDGLNWFHWVGSRPGYRVVWPLPGRRTGRASIHR